MSDIVKIRNCDSRLEAIHLFMLPKSLGLGVNYGYCKRSKSLNPRVRSLR